MIQQVASEKNRIIRILEDCNIKLSSVLSSTSGATATQLINKLCEGRPITKEDIDEVYHAKIQASKEELYEDCQGFVEAHHIYLLGTVRHSIATTELTIDDLSKRIKALLSEYDNVLELLRGISGLSTKTVEDLVAEIGLDMSVFPTEKHLASWAGISPGNNESLIPHDTTDWQQDEAKREP